MNRDGQLTSHGIHPFSRLVAEILSTSFFRTNFVYLDERPVTDLFDTIKKTPATHPWSANRVHPVDRRVGTGGT